MADYRSTDREATALRSFSQLIRPWSSHVALIVLLVGSLALADMVLPWALALLIDNVFPALQDDKGWDLLVIILISLCAIYVLRNILYFASRMISVRVSEQVCFNLRQRLFDHLQQLSMSFYTSNKPGKISSRVMDDTFRIQTFIQDKLPTLLRYIIEFQILMILLFIVNWKLALASTIVLPLHLLAYKKFYLPIRDSHHRAQEHLAAAHGNLIETFLGAQVVKGFSAEKRESESFLETIRAGRDDQINTQRFQFAQKVVADLLVGAGTVLLLGYGAWEVHAGSMSIGLFLMFFWYVRMLYPAVLEVISGTGHFSRTSASVDRVLEMLDEPVSEIAYDLRSRTHSLQLAGPIELHDVALTYDAKTEVLRNINLHIDVGEHIAITGPSGCGKSSFISLLPRFNDPTSGSITIGGHNIRNVRLQDVRAMYGVAFQDAFLFNSSIIDNLRYARPSASAIEIVEACRLTGAHDFIERLPKGYDTRIGDKGGELSHGQKQRINIARALVRRPQVLIIDEATASLEAVEAKVIITSILKQMKDRTVIIVTHDPIVLGLVQRVITLNHSTITSDQSIDNNNMKHPTAKTPSKSHIGPTAGALLLACTLFYGCTTTTSTSSIELDKPKSSGLIIESDDNVDLDALADALDAMASKQSEPLLVMQDAPAPSPPIAPTPEEIADLVPTTEVKNSSITTVDLPRVNNIEMDELVHRLADKYSIDHNYDMASDILDGVMKQLPKGVEELLSIAKKEGTDTKIIRFGYQTFRSQPTQFWVEGITITENTIAPNVDSELATAYVAELITSLEAMRATITVQHLEKRIIQLSYVDAKSAIDMLNGLGVTTFTKIEEVPDQVNWDALPYVTQIPDPASGDTGLVGSASTTGGEFGLTTVPKTAGALSSNTISSPMTQLMVFFDPSHPEHFSHIEHLIATLIDRAAKQIFIEGMVLEIKEDGLKDIGINWHMLDANNPDLLDLRVGKTNAGVDGDTFNFTLTDLNFERAFSRLNSWWFDVDIRALIRDGKAEILSRPSVLTLNNRQATIRVGEEIPIATSTSGIINADMLAFNFKYLPTGIMLNIRPRIAANGKEVSMLIDTIVSSVVLGADLEIRDASQRLLASAPTISSRRVQTYGRIPNNTPFIIGGLVNKEHHTIHDKVPILGDLPIIGGLFRAERTESHKTEVIIVLTPHVLPSTGKLLSAMPKDDPRFDDFGNELFRDSYRIRDEDVFDLSFLEKNKQLQLYRGFASEAIDDNYLLASDPAFSPFAKGHYPGESILVTRMIYEVIKRLGVEDDIHASRLAFFKSEFNGGMNVQFIDVTLTQSVGVTSIEDFYRVNKNKAVILTFEEGVEIPTTRTVDCTDRATWKDLLWSLNQTNSKGINQHSIVIQNEKDMTRLRRSIALKRFLEINSGDATLALELFRAGQYVLVPDLNPKQVHIIDEDVAKYFFQTEHYYAATLQAIKDAITHLDTALDRE